MAQQTQSTYHGPNRRHFFLGAGASLLLASTSLVNPSQAFADADDGIISGTARINGKPQPVGNLKSFKVQTGSEKAVLKTASDIFYLDPETEAEFERASDGGVAQINIAAGGLLSVFDPNRSQRAQIRTPNATGSIRGTGTYFAYQAKEERTYVCCCYGGVDLANDAGGGKEMRTAYHTAVVLPASGGVEPAPYSVPLDHYDDDLVALEARVGREPRWQLPDNKMHFHAPEKLSL